MFKTNSYSTYATHPADPDLLELDTYGLESLANSGRQSDRNRVIQEMQRRLGKRSDLGKHRNRRLEAAYRRVIAIPRENGKLVYGRFS